MKALLLLLFCFDPAWFSVIKTRHWYDYNPMNWAAAQDYCRRTHTAELLTARASQHFGTNMDKYYAWCGLHRTSSDQPWQWVNDTSWNGIPHFKEDPDKGEKCAAAKYNKPRARRKFCDFVTFPFCQDSNNTFTFVTKAMNWTAARDHCRSLNQHLAAFKMGSADSPAKVKRDFPVWTGLHFSDSGSRLASGSCMAISSQNKSKSVQRCSEAFPFLCQRDNVVLVQEHLSWDQALEHCRNYTNYTNLLNPDQPSSNQRSFQLLSLEESELEFALHQASGAKTSKVWVGLRFLAGSWLWSDGTPVSLTSLPSWCPEFYCGALDLSSYSIKPTDCRQKLNLLCYQE